MARLSYVGGTPAADEDLCNRLQAMARFNSAPVTRTTASSDAHDAALACATKTYVDGQDAQYALVDYYQTRDALNTPPDTLGVPNGAATLNSNTKVPLDQIPVMGAGYLKGPYGPTSITLPSGVTTTPVKFADIHVGQPSITFRPLVYASVIVVPTGDARPVIEARRSDGQAVYASQTLTSQGMGRYPFNDDQVVALVPAPAVTGTTDGAGLSSTTDLWVSLWLYDIAGIGSLTIPENGVLSASVFLMRTTL